MSARTLTLEASLAVAMRQRLARLMPEESQAERLRHYQDDPVRFAREVLGFEPTRRQQEILRAVAAHKRVSVRSGRRVGKSQAFAVLALWFYCCHGPDARVILMATTERQVHGILWRAIAMLVARAKLPIPGAVDMGDSAKRGLEWREMFCEIKGYTARDPEAVAGIAGAKLMYLIDEASGVKQAIFDAIEGNRAGGNAWICLISNPTRNDGYFFDSHHSKSAAVIGDEHGFHAIAISSLESPNVTGECGDTPIPGLADPQWIEGMKVNWGEDSSHYRVHVLGEFAVNEERKLFSLAMLHDAQARWGETIAEGRLWIGIDPAGPGGQGDETAIVWRRGRKMLGVRRERGLSAEKHLAHVLSIIAEAHEAGQLPPVVVLDASGDVGRDVRHALADHLDHLVNAFELVKTMGSWPAQRLPGVYVTMRDEIAKSAEDWIRDGGAIFEDVKLERDLHVLEFDPATKDRLALIKKDGPNGIRAQLGRSPDTGDAFMLACWEPRRLRASEETTPRMSAVASVVTTEPGSFRHSSAIDPYGSPLSPYG